MYWRAFFVVFFFGLAGVAPVTRAADQPPLLPVEFFFANPTAAWEHRISADGTRLAWVAMHDGQAKLHFRKLNETEAKIVRMPREARPPSFGDTFHWKGKYLLYVADANGDENAQLYVVDTDDAQPAPRNLTPLDGVRVEYVRGVNNDAEAVVIRHNGRIRSAFDVYRLNIISGQSEMIAQNPGSVCSWGVTPLGNVRLRFHCNADGGWMMDTWDRGSWRQVISGGYGDYVRVVGFTRNPHYVWALSNRTRDRLALVRLDLRNGDEVVLYEHPSVDVNSARVSDGGILRYATSYSTKQEWHFLDVYLQADLDKFLKKERSAIRILSEDRNFRWLTFSIVSDLEGAAVYLMNRATGEVTTLAEANAKTMSAHLARTEHISFPARDGLTVHGLLTVPKGAQGPGPMVLLVHGGPWARDHWGFNPVAQFLANRGYAVLQVNYRGSTEYGRQFLLAGTKEFGRKMHDDLIDGVNWAVANGFADAKRVAIMGGSYGGYAALSGAAFTPDVFAAAIDRVGISDMVSLIEDWPVYWQTGEMGFWKKFYGDPKDPKGRAYLMERSPLHSVDAIRIPLLVVHGANDVRVRRDHSDRIVEALKARKRDVQYIVFDDEGHGLNRTANQLTFVRAVEKFLARHLGGRGETVDAAPAAGAR
jgi:acetyl esterase/lipase